MFYFYVCSHQGDIRQAETNRPLSGRRLCLTIDHQSEVGEACHITFKAVVSDRQTEVSEACHHV